MGLSGGNKMKVTSNNKEIGFKPVTIKITFETQEELDKIGSLFNLTTVNNVINARCIYKEIEEMGGDIHLYINDFLDSFNNIGGRI